MLAKSIEHIKRLSLNYKATYVEYVILESNEYFSGFF